MQEYTSHTSARIAHEDFENEVRRVARALWPEAEFSGAINLGGRETDGLFETEDCVHIVEATTSRRMEKAKHDINKLLSNLRKRQSVSGTKAVRGWFVTKHEPTADQRKITDKHRQQINTMSFSQFQSRLIDSRSYLSARDNYNFGSVRDPSTGQPHKEIQYVPLDLLRLETKNSVSQEEFLSLFESGRTIVLLGDYGAGKSMTLREVYRHLRRKYLKGETSRFPVYINLRDHHGQRDPAEIFTRHSTSIGFSQPNHIIRAWRAGYVHLLIDGFDEVSITTIQRLWRDVRENRYRSIEGVRRLIREHPIGGGLLIAGREHFFDNRKERHRAFDLPRDAVELTLSEFTQDQIDTYLKRVGIRCVVPSWLPSRPLLVGYLAAKGLLRDFLDTGVAEQELGPAVGWNLLLDSIASREAQIEAGIDGESVRKILERLATIVRASVTGLGPLDPESLIEAFKDVCGYSPDEQGMVLLQRLPGLGVYLDEENSRIFVDDAFVEACKAGDLVEFVNDPFNFPRHVLEAMESSIGKLGIDVAALRVKDVTEGKINAALELALELGADHMVADLIRVMWDLGLSVRSSVSVRGVLVRHIECSSSNADLSTVLFRDCYFSRIEVDTDLDQSKLPVFSQCYVEELDGRVSESDLPQGRFKECEISSFVTTTETMAKVLELEIPLGSRVCLTILKKLYERSGSGRKENALYRGLNTHARRLVPTVLKILQSENLAIPIKTRGTTIWLPSRNHRARVGRIIAAPATVSDPVLQRCSSD